MKQAKKTIYIAGKITGLPYRRTWLKFWLREMMLRWHGFNVVNPMCEIPKHWSWQDAISACLILVERCDCIYVAHNWRESKGAYRELRLARKLGKQIFHF